MQIKDLSNSLQISAFVFFFAFGDDCFLINHIKVCTLDQIAGKLDNLKLVKLAAQQFGLPPGKVLFDADKKFYYKIYSTPCTQMDVCMQAICRGFFDDLAPLEHVILDHGRLVGYCTRAGYVAQFDEQLSKMTYAGWGMIFDDIEKQPTEFKSLCKKLLDRMLQHGCIFIDFAPWNVVFCDGKYQLIDIESLMEPAQLSQNKSALSDTILLYINIDYKTRVLSKMLLPFLTAEYLEQIINLAHSTVSKRRLFLEAISRILKRTTFVKHTEITEYGKVTPFVKTEKVRLFGKPQGPPFDGELESQQTVIASMGPFLSGE